LSAVDHETRRNAFARDVPYRDLLLPAAAALAGLALLLYAYRGLAERPFAADDYQWLLNVRGLGLGQVVRAAFDAGAQSHFYRPLVWLLFWAQSQLFGLAPRGYHLVSLALHVSNVVLLATLVWRLGAGRWSALLAAIFALLHPAPFEAVVWISAQSELLAAGLLLVMLHLWRLPSRFAPLLATVALGLALLAKESAVIGLPLLVLLGRPTTDESSGDGPPRAGLRFWSRRAFAVRHSALPTLLTLAYLALQISVERRNYLLRGGYGLGPQLIANPLHSLALIVAPLPGSEHADARWLLPLGAIIALDLLALFAYGLWDVRRLLLTLLLTLLPAAPFASPPDSRYLYLPVLATALLLAFSYDERRRLPRDLDTRHRSVIRHWLLVAGVWLLVALLAWSAAREDAAREGRFAAASGPGGSLWHTTTALCREDTPKRVIVIDPPLAAPHVEAIIRLSCGADVRPLIVGRDQATKVINPGAIMIGFSEGSAQIEQRN
jgi:hypothetical protein